MTFAHLKSISQNTLVPLGVTLAALGFGWWWRGREADRDSSIESRLARLETKLDVIIESTRELKMSAVTDEELDQKWRLFCALNPSLMFPPHWR